MAARSSWKGYLRLSLVSVPVQAFNAAESGGGELHFHQLHAACHNRIRYQKICPVHGEVPNDEIVRGYEYAKGQYVVIDDDEVDKLRTASDRAINIDTFVSADAIDPVYFDGRTYYLAPDGAMANKPYAVLVEALKHLNRWAVGQAVFFGREQLVLIRPREGVLCVEMLHYPEKIRAAGDVVGELDAGPVPKEELRLATKLIESSTRKKFDLSRYHDQYTERVQQLIDAKIQGKEIVKAPREEESPVINLMDALRKSVAQTQGLGKKTAALSRATPAAKRRRTTKRRTA
jgi:DNA end-binding protein Ku